MNAYANTDAAPIVYDEPSKFPPMDYDISVEVPQGMFFSHLAECWKTKAERFSKAQRLLTHMTQIQFTA